MLFFFFFRLVLSRTIYTRKWQHTPVFLPGEFHGQRSLAGYSRRGRKESDTTERHYHSFSILIHLETRHLLGLMSNYQIILKANRISKMFCDLYSTNNYFPIILNSHERYMNDGTYGKIFKKQSNKKPKPDILY